MSVTFEEYEAMPHCFQMLLPGLKTGDMCFRSWGEFCRRCVEEPGAVKGSGKLVRAKSGEMEGLDVGTVSEMTLEDVRRRVGEAKERRVRAFEGRVEAAAKAVL